MTHAVTRGRRPDVGGVGLEHTQLPPYDDGPLDPRDWFEQGDGRLEIEIGSGKGTFLVQQAPRHPATRYLGIERSPEFYRYAADRIRRRGLANVRLLRADAVEFLRYWCADGVAAVIHLYFSDPWPKKKHHKRRVVQDRSLADFHRVLAPAGQLRIVTDHDDLWAWCEAHAARHEDLFERRAFEVVESAGAGEMVGSNFERKYRVEGRPFHAMTLVKRSL